MLTSWTLASIVLAPIAGRLVEQVHAGLLDCLGWAAFTLGRSCWRLPDNLPGFGHRLP